MDNWKNWMFIINLSCGQIKNYHMYETYNEVTSKAK